MKNKFWLVSFLATFVAGAAIAQDIESDDMYFNSGDRAKLNAYRKTLVASNVSSKKATIVDEEDNDEVNPTDSYSARNVNPEYTSRAQSQTSRADDEDYFVNDYRYNTQSNFNNFNNRYNNWYGNQWYSNAYWGPSMNNWNTPYYGSYYDPYGNPWANPYYGSGWSSSFSYYWGNSYNYGWNMGYGYNNGWGCPYNNPYNSWYGYNYGYGSNYYGYGYPTRVIVIDETNYRGPVYGKRGSRSSGIIRDYENGTGRTSSTTNGNGRVSSGGRQRTNSSNQSQYYERTWQNNQNSGTTNNNSGSTNGRSSSSSWGNSSNSGSNTMRQSTNSNSSYTPSRSSNSSSSGTRSSSGGGGSSGTRTSRGRGN